MGMLDRLVADLIADSTGLPVRRLVRRVGVGRLLLLGGAAAAGGYAVHQMSQGQGAAGPPPPPPAPAGGSPRPATPLPPVPVPPPPPPPQPTAETAVHPDIELILARTMVAAALADGRLDEAERRVLAHHLDSGEIPEVHAERIHRDLASPATPESLSMMVSEPTHRDAIVRAALLVLAADNDISDAERAWLQRLGEALGLPPARLAELESELAGLAAQVD